MAIPPRMLRLPLPERTRRAFDDDCLVGPRVADQNRLVLSYHRLMAPKRLIEVAGHYRLSGRELQTLILHIKGIPTATAADSLGVGLSTLQKYWYRCKLKMGVTCAPRACLKYVLTCGICLQEDRGDDDDD